MPLQQQILIGLGLGVLTGMLLKTDALVLAPIGTLFLNAIKMLIVPLVFVSLVAGITAMSDSAKLGRISIKTITIYLVTTAFAVSIGLFFGALFTPGEGMNMVASGAQDVKQAPSLMQILVDLVPTNPVNAFAQGNILQIIVFAIALGVSMNMLALLARLSPLRFFRGVAPALTVAFSTSSSAGTLPVSIECARKNLGVSQGVAGFVLPVGATINMDGTAIYQGVLALFIAQAFGVELNGAQYLMIILTATLASVGTAGVPGAGLIMLGLVLTSVGLPLEGVALIAGIDRILDMARTTVNVAGDLMTTTLVGHSEHELDQTIYNSDNAQ